MNVYECAACGVLQSDAGECPVCGNTEYDEHSLGGYVCDECGEEYDTLAALRSHQRAHDE